jgi:CBS domain-containing protein
MTYISSVMSKPVVTAKEEAKISEIVRLMVKTQVGMIAIVDSDMIPCGIITEREFLKNIATDNRVSMESVARDFMSSGFVRLHPETSVNRAADIMISERVRLLVTRKNGTLAGIVTATDLLYNFSKVCKDIPIKHDLSTNVKTLDVSKSFLDAAKLMFEKKIGSVVITEGELKFGIVTERDLLKALSKDREKGFDEVRLQDIASRPLVSAPYGVTAKEAAQVMEANKIKRLVLFKGEKMTGIITARDLVAAFVSSIQISPIAETEKERKTYETSTAL